MKLNTGDKVKVINYGATMLIPKANYKEGSFPILEDTGNNVFVDTAPYLIGKEGNIVGSTVNLGTELYTLDIEGSIKSGFHINQLEKC